VATDDALVAAALADGRAFEAIYTRYVGPVYRYCHVRLGNPEAAEPLARKRRRQLRPRLAPMTLGEPQEAAYVINRYDSVVKTRESDGPAFSASCPNGPTDSATDCVVWSQTATSWKSGGR